MLILENIKLALIAIRINKMRSFLTMLGMIIGISSVIAIVSIGDTMRSVLAQQYESFGKGNAFIYMNPADGEMTSVDLFTFDDIELLRQTFGERLAYITSASEDRSTVMQGNKSLQIRNVGVALDYSNIKKVEIVAGRMLSNEDVVGKKKHIVIEDVLAKELFGRVDKAVGQTLKVSIFKKVDELLVVGVYHNTQTAFERLIAGGSAMQGAYTPETVMQSQDASFWGMDINMAEGANAELFQKQFVSMIARMKNRSVDEIVFSSTDDNRAMMDSMMGNMSAAVGAIAAISLVVGGIGIMNIMLVSVTERTREIGIRKALGARTGDVMIQFLVESSIISAVGGIIGTTIGVGLVTIGGAIVDVSVVVQPSVVLTAIGFSAVVGIFFGLYPARKAAKADPITALRYE